MSDALNMIECYAAEVTVRGGVVTARIDNGLDVPLTATCRLPPNAVTAAKALERRPRNSFARAVLVACLRAA